MCEEKKPNITSTTDIEKLRELVEMMSTNDLVELEIVDGENKIHLKRPAPEAPQQIFTQMPMAAPAMQPMQQAAAAPTATGAPAAPSVPASDDHLAEVPSPIVGTFYTAPSPDSDPYIKVGDRVEPETTVCIIEAMKVMNEIKAEISGTIEKLCVSNGEAVEFGQALFKVKPD